MIDIDIDHCNVRDDDNSVAGCLDPVRIVRRPSRPERKIQRRAPGGQSQTIFTAEELEMIQFINQAVLDHRIAVHMQRVEAEEKRRNEAILAARDSGKGKPRRDQVCPGCEKSFRARRWASGQWPTFCPPCGHKSRTRHFKRRKHAVPTGQPEPVRATGESGGGEAPQPGGAAVQPGG